MNFYALRFNLYLPLLLLAAGLAVTGCETTQPNKPAKKEKNLATLRMHLENRAQLANSGEKITVLRSEPVMVTVNTDPILTENNVVSAKLLESPVGYAIEVKFDTSGTMIYEEYTSANPGRHFAIFSQWSDLAKDSRWLAAPLISRRNSTGVMAFTPDASLAETKLIVAGLNNNAKKIAKGKMK